MQSIFLLVDTPAWLVLLIGTLLLMLWMSYFGFRPKEVKQLLHDFEERRQTEIGKQAEIPTVIEYLKGGGGVMFILVPLIILLSIGIIFFQLPDGMMNLMALPILLVEAFGVWGFLKLSRARYQAGYDEYMRLTAPGNDYFLAKEFEQHAPIRETGNQEALFVSQDAAGLLLGYPEAVQENYPLPDPKTWIQVFYRPTLGSHILDGEIVGFQCVPRRSEATGPTLPHILRDFDQYREGQMN